MRDRLSGFAYWLAIVHGQRRRAADHRPDVQPAPVRRADHRHVVLLSDARAVPVARLPGVSRARGRAAWRYPGTIGRCSLLCIGATGYLAWNGGRIVAEGWDLAAPAEAVVVAGIVCLLALEGVRRAGRA